MKKCDFPYVSLPEGNNCMSWVCPSSIHFHSVPRQGSGTGYGRGVSQWRWKHNRGAVGQNRISFGKWQSVSIRFLGVSENGVCHQIIATIYILYIIYIIYYIYILYIYYILYIIYMYIYIYISHLYHHIPSISCHSDRDTGLICITGSSPGTSELRADSSRRNDVGRNVLNREVAKDGDTANMPRPAAVEARE